MQRLPEKQEVTAFTNPCAQRTLVGEHLLGLHVLQRMPWDVLGQDAKALLPGTGWGAPRGI